MRIRLGIDLQEGGPKLGRGKVRLLAAIREHGSISGAARSMGMSYRHAWILLDELNRAFEEPVIVSTMGGPHGGGARLTPWGEELIERFGAMQRDAEAALAEHIEALEARAAGSGRATQRASRRSRSR
ncbi:MAG: winged helix-turn-helix domain-containing protein [Myxococcota bacterium]